MRTLNVSISDTEFNQFGLQEEELTFNLITLIRRQLMAKI